MCGFVVIYWGWSSISATDKLVLLHLTGVCVCVCVRTYVCTCTHEHLSRVEVMTKHAHHSVRVSKVGLCVTQLAWHGHMLNT